LFLRGLIESDNNAIIYKVLKSVVQGFSFVHDPEGSYYENLRGEWVLKLNETNLVLNRRQN